MGEGFILKPFRVHVTGFSGCIYHARSRQKALATCWRDYGSYEEVSFGQFLKMARVEVVEPDQRHGEAITVGGEPAFYVSHNSQYIQFVRPWTDVILNTHPLDVMPAEARRGTPYYQEQPS